MGHEMCGAVKAAAETPASTSLGPNLDYLLKAIRPAVARAANQPAETRLRAAILENVEETINVLLDTSAVLRHLIETERLGIAGAYYELATGRVHFSEPVRVPPRVTKPGGPRGTSHEQGDSTRGGVASLSAPAAQSGVPAIAPATAVHVPAPVVQSPPPAPATSKSQTGAVTPASPAAKPQSGAAVTPQQPATSKPQSGAVASLPSPSSSRSRPRRLRNRIESVDA